MWEEQPRKESEIQFPIRWNTEPLCTSVYLLIKQDLFIHTAPMLFLIFKQCSHAPNPVLSSRDKKKKKCGASLQVGFPGGSVVKNPPANAGDAGDQVRSLGWEDPLEQEMATHSSILAWGIPQTEKLAGYRLWGCKESDMTECAHVHKKYRWRSPAAC